MEKQKKSVGTTLLVILLLIVTIAALVMATYAWAKYTEKVAENTSNVTVAKWNVTATVNGTAQYTKEFTHVVPTKMAPGTSGVIPVDVALNATEVCVRYDIYLDNVTNKPTNAKFYEATRSGEGTQQSPYVYAKTGNELVYGNGAVSSTPAVTGYLELTNDNTVNSNAKSTKYIMWEWPYETGSTAEEKAANDAIDTTDGKAAATMSVSVRVVATQVDPNSVATLDN